MTEKHKDEPDFEKKEGKDTKVETVEETPPPVEEPEYEEAEAIRILEEVLGELQKKDQNDRTAQAQAAINQAINALKVVANKSLTYLGQ